MKDILPTKYIPINDFNPRYPISNNCFYNFSAHVQSYKEEKNRIILQVNIGTNETYKIIHSIKLKALFSAQRGKKINFYGKFSGNDIYFPTIGSCLNQILPTYEQSRISSKVMMNYFNKHSPEILLKYFQAIHSPTDINLSNIALRKLLHYELAVINFVLEEKKRKKIPKKTNFNYKLPFELTHEQKYVLENIYLNLEKDYRTISLIHGDVGCGKTVLAYLSACQVLENQYNVAVLLPTSLLAQQTYDTFIKYSNNNISIQFITPNNKKQQLTTSPTIFIGTHALFYKDIQNIGLLIIDEQQRFGVLQRSYLYQDNTDVLMLSATPIPRTLALMLQGSINTFELKKSYKHTERITKVFSQNEIDNIMLRTIDYAEFKRIIWVEHSISNAEMIYQKFHEKIPNVNLIHSKIKEKNQILHDFANRFGILVSTTVIEVGIDLDIDIIIISNADYFGLSQIHQLRGRIARRKESGLCILMGHNIKKLRDIQKAQDGFEISELDLRNRGGGNILTKEQSGFDYLRFAFQIQHYSVIPYHITEFDVEESKKIKLTKEIINYFCIETDDLMI